MRTGATAQMGEQPCVAKFKLTAARAQKIIRERSKGGSNIIWGNHARERMLERGIETTDVIDILRRGFVDEDPAPGIQRGEWKCKVTKRIRGSRTAGAITIILLGGELFVKTVEWEDIR